MVGALSRLRSPDLAVAVRYISGRSTSLAPLERLAQRSGLDESFIVDILDHDVYPSLGPLLKIARALGIRLGTFIDDKVSRDPLVIRRDERKQELSMLHSPEGQTASRFYSLGRGKGDRRMEPFFVELLPESGREKKLSSHEGEEFIYVLSGEVSLKIGDDTFGLEPGDSVYYLSTTPHHIAAKMDKATILAVLYEG